MDTVITPKHTEEMFHGIDRIVNIVMDYAVPFDPYFTVEKAVDDSTLPVGKETAKVSVWVFLLGLTEKPLSLSPTNMHRVHDDELNLNPEGVVFFSFYAQEYVRQLIEAHKEWEFYETQRAAANQWGVFHSTVVLPNLTVKEIRAAILNMYPMFEDIRILNQDYDIIYEPTQESAMTYEYVCS